MGDNSCSVLGNNVYKAISIALQSKVSTVEGVEMVGHINALHSLLSRTNNIEKIAFGKRALDFKSAVANGQADELLRVLTSTVIPNEDGSMTVIPRVNSLEELKGFGKDVDSQAILRNVQAKVDSLMKEVIKIESNPEELYAHIDNIDFVNRFRGYLWAHKSGLFVDKILSGTWIPGVEDSILGNRAIIFRSHNKIDRVRAVKVKAFAEEESRINDLIADATNIISRSGAVKSGLGIIGTAKLLKYYDEDLAGASGNKDSYIRNRIDEYIGNPENKVTYNIDKDVFIENIKNSLDVTVSEIRQFNYGKDYKSEGDGFFKTFYKDWESYPKSYIYGIIKTGTEYVRMIENHMLDGGSKLTLGESEKAMLSRFAMYHFKAYEDIDANNNKTYVGNAGDIQRFQALADVYGLSMSKDDAFLVRSDYMHIHQYDQSNIIESNNIVSRGGEYTASALSSRRDTNVEDNSDMLTNMIKNIEQYRIMSTKSLDLTFARITNDILDRDNEWTMNNPREYNDLKKFTRLTLAKAERNTYQMTDIAMASKQAAYALLALSTSGILALGGIKNVYQGYISLVSNIGMDEYFDKRTGTFSLKKAKLSEDKNIVKMADVIDKYVMPASGKRADMILHDINAESGNIKRIAKLSADVMNFAEKTYHYSVFAPLKMMADAYFPGGKLSNAADWVKDSWFSMSGSEKYLRSWKMNEAMFHVISEYKIDMDFIEKNSNSSDEAMRKSAETLSKRWTSNKIEDTIKSSLAEIEYELYNKDAEYFGDFNPDSKPFWTHALENAETFPQVMLGFLATSVMTFRHPVNYALNQAIQNTAKQAGRKNFVNIPMGQALLFFMDIANDVSESSREKFGFISDSPLLNAWNQASDASLPFKGVAALCGAGLNMPMTKESYLRIASDYARWTGGLLAGRTLESMAESYYRGEPLFAVMNARFNSTSDIPKLLTAKTFAQYQRASEGVRQASRMTLPFFDTMLSSSNDYVKLILETYKGISAITHITKAKESKQMTQELLKSAGSIRDNLLGLGVGSLYQTSPTLDNILRNKTNQSLYQVHIEDQISMTDDPALVERLEGELE